MKIFKKVSFLGVLLAMVMLTSGCSKTETTKTDSGNTPDAKIYDELYSNNNIGSCAFTDKSTFEITEKAYISKIRMWYYWDKKETELPFTLKKDGKEIISGILIREGCDPHQKSWCEANYYPKSNFEAGKYELKVETAKLCQNSESDGNGMYRLLGEQVDEQTDTFIDSRDSKSYKFVTIGDQVWMAENLAYIGSDIKHITDNSEWENNSDNDGWCYYDNDENYGNTNGVLYQWEAAKIACPSDWHLPTNAEWAELVSYPKKNGYSYNGVIGHDGIAKSLASNSSWDVSDNEGAVGNPDFPELRNKTGFSALQTGQRNLMGDFFAYGYCMWWSDTEGSRSSNANSRGLSYDKTKMTYTSYFKQYGFSVRCIRD